MNCTNCGEELLEGAKFCVGCGKMVEEPAVNAPVEEVTPVEGSALEEEAAIGEASAVAMEATVGVEPVFEEATVMDAAPMFEEGTAIGIEPMNEMAFAPEAAPVHSEAAVGAMTIPEPNAAKKAEKKSFFQKLGTGKLIALCACSVAVIALVVAAVIFLPKLLKGKEDGGKAAQEAASAEGMSGKKADYEKNGKLFDAGLNEDAKKLEKYSFDLDLEFLGGTVFEDGGMVGFGLNYTQDINKKDREVGFTAAVSANGETMNGQLLIEDDELYIELPDLLESGLYGVNTETLGTDLGKLSALGLEDLEDWGNLSFNVFDLMELATDISGVEEKVPLAQSVADLAVSMEKTEVGSEVIEIHGENYECTKYDGLLKEEHAEEFLYNVADRVGGLDYQGAVEAVITGLGLPEDTEEELLQEFDMENPDMSEAADGIHELVSAVGDIEMDLYYSGEFLMAAIYEKEIEGGTLTISLYISGEKYADEVSLIIEVDDDDDENLDALEIHSTGNHNGEGDVFTDKTVVRGVYGYAEVTLLTLELDYAYGEDKDNFDWALEVPAADIAVTADGTLQIGGGEIELDLDQIKVEVAEETLIEMSGRIRFANYEKRVSGKKKMLPEMTMLELYRVAALISENQEAFNEKAEIVFGGF